MSMTADDINAMLENNERLSKWERDFLGDMAERMEKGLIISEGQSDKLSEIEKKYDG